MKKKIFMLFLFVVAIVLASCSSNTSRESALIEGDINIDYGTLSDKYNLAFAKVDNLESDCIDLGKKATSDKSDTDYYNVYISKDTNNTLFRYVYDATEDLSSHIYNENRNKNKTYIANSLYFNLLYKYAETVCKNKVDTNAKNYEEELSYYKQSLVNIVMNQRVLDIVYQADGTFNTLKFEGYSFEKDFTSSFSKTVDSSYAGEAKKDGIDKINFEIVYLPIYVVRTIGGNHISSVVMLPVYETFTNNDKEIVIKDGKYELVDSKIKDIKSIDISFDAESGTIIG